MTAHSTYVDAAFPLSGPAIPIDHGYPLFAALSRRLPTLHDSRHWAVHPVRGSYRQDRGVLELISESQVKIRLPADELAHIIGLAQATLDIRGHHYTLGYPRIYPLITAPLLKSRLVVIKGHTGDPEGFGDAVRRQLAALPGLGCDPERIQIIVGPRRVVRVKGVPIPGHAVSLSGLDVTACLVVQIHGLGGRHHLGAGVFVPPGMHNGSASSAPVAGS